MLSPCGEYFWGSRSTAGPGELPLHPFHGFRCNAQGDCFHLGCVIYCVKATHFIQCAVDVVAGLLLEKGYFHLLTPLLHLAIGLLHLVLSSTGVEVVLCSPAPLFFVRFLRPRPQHPPQESQWRNIKLLDDGKTYVGEKSVDEARMLVAARQVSGEVQNLLFSQFNKLSALESEHRAGMVVKVADNQVVDVIEELRDDTIVMWAKPNVSKEGVVVEQQKA